MWTRVGRNESMIWAFTACQVQINLNLSLKHPYLNENSLCTDQMQLPELSIYSLQHTSRHFIVYTFIWLNKVKLALMNMPYKLVKLRKSNFRFANIMKGMKSE